MNCDPSQADRINSFALVGYINGKLGDFLNSLRAELVRGCLASAHVTVLPPRPLSIDIASGERELSARLEAFSPFPIEITGVRIFPVTDVIFAEVGLGRAQLTELHEKLNVNDLHFREPHEYHPHVTLAQGVTLADLPAVYELACRRWKEELPSHRFMLEKLTFVQNTVENIWVDLAEFDLRSPVLVRR
jgi:2'-5' RNA ligase